MEIFEWSPLFETGLDEVDAQHRRLVELVNELERDSESASAEHIDQMLNALADYTVYHFRCEEAIMDASHVAAEYGERHREIHRRFVSQVSEWIATRKAARAIDLRQLVDFLVNWLIFHILGEDQSLGRQISAIRAGVGPDQAWAQDRTSEDPRTDILLGALRSLYGGLVERNEELMAAQNSLSSLNATLEMRVAERTAELVDANRRLKQEQEAVLEAEKMASLGRMVAGFAHEVNTPVGIAVGAVSQICELVAELNKLLDKEEVSEEDLRGRIGMIDEGSALAMNNLRRAAGMVQSFKRTAVDQASEAERDYELAEVIEDVCKSLGGAFRGTEIRIDASCASNVHLHGPAGILVQLLTNLMLNSRMHAFADGTLAGTITIRAGLAGETVWLDYSDDGAGMSADTLEHAFEPFFTTRRGTGGSGLGLYIVYNLATKGLAGSISCESIRGSGTRFRIEYPFRISLNSGARSDEIR